MSFRDLGLEPRIQKAVAEAGYTEPTPIQSAAIPPIVAGHDLIGIAQTGTGKTAAFTLPILTRLAQLPPGQRGTKLLVLAPTRELAVQIEENIRIYAKHLSFTIATVFGGVGEQPQIRALRNGTDIIIACPGRLLDLMGRGCADFSKLKFLVLDEADRMLDMGFIPDIRRIVQKVPDQRQTLLFSATLSEEIETLTDQFQRNPKLIQIGRRANPAETVKQLIYEVPKHLKTSLLLHLLQEPQMNMVLVFSRMKHGADRIARQLEQKGIRTATLHSNRSQNQRLRALKDFKSGTVRVLVATDIAARGIDVDGISHVVNYDFPLHVEDYIHRIGRTGRANAIGDAISFVTSEDTGELRALEKFIGRGIVRKRAEGFDYSQAPQPKQPHPNQQPNQNRHQQQPRHQNQRPQPARHQQPNQRHAQQSGQPSHQGHGQQRHGHSHSHQGDHQHKSQQHGQQHQPKHQGQHRPQPKPQARPEPPRILDPLDWYPGQPNPKHVPGRRPNPQRSQHPQRQQGSRQDSRGRSGQRWNR